MSKYASHRSRQTPGQLVHDTVKKENIIYGTLKCFPYLFLELGMMKSRQLFQAFEDSCFLIDTS